MSCSGCQSYRDGQGSKACLVCPDQPEPKILIKPGPRIINMRSEIIEEMAEMIPKTVKEILVTLDPLDSTMLLQSIILNMTHKEIADYHLFNATKTVQRKLSNALDILKSMST